VNGLSASPAADFDEIVRLIEAARQRATQAVNVALIDLYWQVGKTISDKLAKAEWGGGVVEQLAAHIAETKPGLRGFTRPNLYRMRQFYEAYAPYPIVSALLRQLSWTHHLAILGQCKRQEERQFYIELTIREKWSSRELERRIKRALFERSILQPAKVSSVLKEVYPDAPNLFRDGYLVKFLELQKDYDERDLHTG